MDIALKLKTAKTARGRRALKERAPKVFENPKTTLFLKANKCSQMVSDIMHDMHSLRKPHSVLYSRKHDIHLFEDETSLHNICNKADASLFVLGSHSKHKPNRLTFGRLFNHQLLDAIELAVSAYHPIVEFAGAKPRLGTKPMLIFQGELFETNEVLASLKSLFLDHFKVSDLKAVDLAGLESVMVFTAASETVLFVRHYVLALKRSGTRVPRVELTEVGPSLDLTVCRQRVADATLMKQSLWKPKEALAKGKKNEEHSLTAKLGRIHMERQDLTKMTTRKVKGLKRKRGDFESSGADSAGTGPADDGAGASGAMSMDD